MAQTPNLVTGPSLARTLSAPFAAIGRFRTAIAEARPLVQQFSRFNEMSDEDLAALGTTRGEMVQKIVGRQGLCCTEYLKAEFPLTPSGLDDGFCDGNAECGEAV
ncbi:hypothetical protein [Limimaricola litoreus]